MTALRPLRILLWAAFLLALVLAVAWRDTDFGAYARYAPPILLLAAMIVTAWEWLARRRGSPEA
jgi:hypothetical protein